MTKKPLNNKNKPLIVNSVDGQDKDIKVFDSIMDTVRHFDVKGIKLDRKSLGCFPPLRGENKKNWSWKTI